MKQNIKETISNVFLEIFAQEVDELPTPELSDDVVLLESGLDSMGFAILVVELEEKLGYDPFTISDEPFYPTTFGEFVNFYEKILLAPMWVLAPMSAHGQPSARSPLDTSGNFPKHNFCKFPFVWSNIV